MPDDKIADNTLSQGELALPENQLGERVRAIRESLGLTHDGLSSLAKLVDVEGRGISRTTIRGYELGTYKPGARELRILSLALKKDPSWLLFGDTHEQVNNDASHQGRDGKPTSAARWAKLAFPLLAFSQLGSEEKQQIVSLIETLFRLKSGEVRFRSMKAFIEDLTDTIQDAFRDRAQYKDVDAETMKQVFFATVADVEKRHGPEEANFLKETMLLIFDYWQLPQG